jgi:hypothetical protein
MKSSFKCYEEQLLSLTEDECLNIVSNPDDLVWKYIGGLSQSISCQLELYRRQWAVCYEPYANTSVVYGHSAHRSQIRSLARGYMRQCRYIEHSLDTMRRLMLTDQRQLALRRPSLLEDTMADFEHFSHELKSLHSQCEEFLRQQVGRIALQEARISLSEGRDLRRLSYLGFIFVPLSLSSSFFSVNVSELNGSKTPLWVFIVTTLAILSFSILVLTMLRSTRLGQQWNYFLDNLKYRGIAIPEAFWKDLDTTPQLKHQNDKFDLSRGRKTGILVPPKGFTRDRSYYPEIPMEAYKYPEKAVRLPIHRTEYPDFFSDGSGPSEGWRAKSFSTNKVGV